MRKLIAVLVMSFLLASMSVTLTPTPASATGSCSGSVKWEFNKTKRYMRARFTYACNTVHNWTFGEVELRNMHNGNLLGSNDTTNVSTYYVVVATGWTPYTCSRSYWAWARGLQTDASVWHNEVVVNKYKYATC